MKCYLIGLAVLASLLQLSSAVDTEQVKLPNYENPIRNEVDDEVTNLPGLKVPINFRQFSGYLPADDSSSPKKFLHYWFVESQSGHPQQDPVVLWLNGGPGCSSMLGFFTELGPFKVEDDAKTLSLNPWSWNKKANVIFLESPAGVGFSYSRSLINVNSDDTTAKQNHLALKSFMNKFPQYKNNSLYLTGESYAGVYLPTLGQLLDADPAFNLKGIAIGNGYLDASKLKDSFVFFAYHHGLIGKSIWQAVSKDCCNNTEPSRDTCNFDKSSSGYKCQLVLLDIQLAISRGINPYNIYGKCDIKKGEEEDKRQDNLEYGYKHKRILREHVDRALLSLMFDADRMKDSQEKLMLVFNSSERIEADPPCTDEHIVSTYLNDPEVRKAIHIPHGVSSWAGCSFLMYVMKYPTRIGGLTPQIRSLIESKRKLRMLVYNGDVDAVCNFLGDEWFVDDLNLEIVNDYTQWKVDNQIAGFYKTHKGLTYATIRGSGHMVPGDRPREALAMFHAFINSTDVPSNAELPKFATL